MKFETSFSDQLINYNSPIKLPKSTPSSNILSKFIFSNTKINSTLDIYTLPDFYPSSLDEKKRALNIFFKNREFNLSNPIFNQHFFNTTLFETYPEMNGDILYDIECALYLLLDIKLPDNLIVHSNTLGLGENFLDSKCVKVKINPDRDFLRDFANILNTKSENIFLPRLRFDGNRQFELSDLIYFLNLLKPNILEKIEYIEEPFRNFYDIYTFRHMFNIKIAIDESLVFFKDHLESLPNSSTIILKPGLFGISVSYKLIQEAYKFNHSVIISSTYQPSTSFLPLLFLANFSDCLNCRPLFHGLDTLKYLPNEYQNAQVLKALSIN